MTGPVVIAHQAVNVYVGADNQTGKIDLDAVARIVSREVDAFTILPARGYWHGAPEPSAMIVIDSDTASIARVITRLRTELGQDAVAVQTAPGLCLDTVSHACIPGEDTTP